MIYTNPIIQADYSDPDAIRVGDDFYMVASSFNQIPGLPILHSKNLVNWELINYAIEELPYEKYNSVRHGEGAWAPAIRYHDGIYYILVPTPDEGIFVTYTKNPYDKWSELKLLIPGRGLEDPCPIWVFDKCYIVIGFAKSRAGFNSCLGLYEASVDLTKLLTPNYTIIYDGHNMNPSIEGPKFNVRNGFFYILAPAGSVKGGWQTCLRSKNIYGPYESKIVLAQGDTLINGPHQGALIDIDDNDHWAFIHFQDMRAYGRIVHLEPVMWYNDWPIIGNVADPLLYGTPVKEHEYLIDKSSDYALQTTDYFNGDKLSLMWQFPANIKDNWYKLDNGLKLYCVKQDNTPLNLCPNMLMQKVSFLEFNINTTCSINFCEDGDEVGFAMMGLKYYYVCVVRRDGRNYLELRCGNVGEDDEILSSTPYDMKEITFNMQAINKDIYKLLYSLGVNSKFMTGYLEAVAGRWIGSKIAIYARSTKNSLGYATFKNFCTNNSKK